jgi:hypothetical protein
VVPYAGADQTKIDTTRREHMRRINNAYWFCHRLLDSRAKASYGSVYDIPETIGPVDVSIYGSILLHLRDPFFALSSAAKLTKSAMIIADVCPFHPKPVTAFALGYVVEFAAAADSEISCDSRLSPFRRDLAPPALSGQAKDALHCGRTSRKFKYSDVKNRP